MLNLRNYFLITFVFNYILGNVIKVKNRSGEMVDKQNGQSQTIAQAEAQVSDIESQLSSRELQLATQESQIRQSFIPGTISSQFAFGSAQALQQARLGLAEEQRVGLLGISEQRGELQEVRGQVATRKGQIESARARKREAERLARVAKVERKIALREFAEDPRRTQAVDQGVIIPEGAIQSLAGGGFLVQRPAIQSLVAPAILPDQKPFESIRALEPISPLRSPLEFAQRELTQRQQQAQLKGVRGQTRVSDILQQPLIGAGQFAVGTARAITRPGETLRGLGSLITSPTARAQAGIALGTQLREAPLIPITQIGLGLGAPAIIRKGVTTGVDVGRTFRLTELPPERIIAPEFFRGETFPTISRGQTAGQLRSEFFQPVLPTEAAGIGRTFTASPVPFRAETIAQAGTSEVAGVFGAPRVSPRFLRVAGETRPGFALNPFGTLRPSIVRITPASVELAPFVSPGQTRPSGRAGVPRAREFFEEAPLGRAVIPFIKTEKEAVLPAGTPLGLTGKDFFVRFEGRRVPIFEFETRAGGIIPTGRGAARAPTIGSVSERLSPRARAQFDPLSLSPLSSIRSLRSRGISTSSGFGFPSRGVSGIPSIGSLSPLVSSRGGGLSFGSPLPSSRGLTPGIPDFGFPSVAGASIISDPFIQRRAPILRGTAEKKPPKKKKLKRPKKVGRVAPSFTASVLDIRGAFPRVDPAFGISPFSIRALPNARPRRKKKR